VERAGDLRADLAPEAGYEVILRFSAVDYVRIYRRGMFEMIELRPCDGDLVNDLDSTVDIVLSSDRSFCISTFKSELNVLSLGKGRFNLQINYT
jgi:hypothetical protein